MILIVVLIAGLCGWRITRAITEEVVGQKFRERVGHWAYAHHPEEIDAPVEEKQPPIDDRPSRWKVWVYDLIVCPYCFGEYVTSAVALVLAPQVLDTSILVYLVLAVAASGVQALLVDVQHRLAAEH